MDKLKEVVALAKRRGFIFPGSEIYGGLANTYDYGPLGAELLKNLRVLWWDEFVTKRAEIYGLETSVIMSPKVWQASGHVGSFTDTVKECKNCHQRARVDQLTDDKCPNCGASDWTEPKKFNLLFETHIGIVPESQSLAYLRGETAQGSFTNFKNVLDTFSPKLPFGLAQMGKVFRNEVTSGQQVFRTLEFDLAEFEYFIGETGKTSLTFGRVRWKNLPSCWGSTKKTSAGGRTPKTSFPITPKGPRIWNTSFPLVSKNGLRWHIGPTLT